MIHSMGNWIAAILLGSATGVFLLSKCLFLAPCRVGFLLVLANLVYEVADLWFHTLVLLANEGLSYQDVLNELARREGVSGIAEKAARKQD